MQAMEAKDYSLLDTILADDLICIHSLSSIQTRTSLISNMKSASTIYAALEPHHAVALDLGEVVVLTGVARAEGQVNGAPISYKVRFIDRYSWCDGRWQMVAWQSTRMPPEEHDTPPIGFAN
jgi:hypothetical protein